ncbi:MAG: hypothetical protein VX700_13010 [Pseudomonadota bacterium]|nr:hypothetical protein [Pseudomonadota bacterium]
MRELAAIRNPTGANDQGIEPYLHFDEKRMRLLFAIISEMAQLQGLTIEKLLSLPKTETYEMFTGQKTSTLRSARLFKQS